MTAEVDRRRAAVTALRARVRDLERGAGGTVERGSSRMARASGAASGAVLPLVQPLGATAIDAHLPGGGLALAGLHEIAGARDEWDDGAALGFCLVLLGRLTAAPARSFMQSFMADSFPARPVLWVARRADLYAPGIAGLGLDPDRLILARAPDDAETFWALEEGLRSRALAAVVGEVAEPDDIAARRLQLAAEAAGRPCFLLRRRLHAARGAGAATAALTRWRVAALPSSEMRARETPLGKTRAENRADLLGRPRWRVELLRCRGAAPRTFTVEWDDAAGDFALVAELRDRTLAPAASAVG